MKRMAEDSEFKPTVSPSVLVRAIAELRKTRKEREVLMAECIEQLAPTETTPEETENADYPTMLETESEVVARPETIAAIPALTG